MSVREPDEPDPRHGHPLFDDELLGLDPDEPEVQAFAAHLDRMAHARPAFTVEGYLHGVGEFADSANRAEGLRRWAAVLLVLLLLLGVLWAAAGAVAFVVDAWVG